MDQSNYPLDMTVMELTDFQDQETPYTHKLTLADCCRNFSVIGSVGSGKSSGFLLTASISFAQLGFSMVIPVAKTDELKTWKQIHEVSGSSGKFVNWTKESGLKFDPLLYLSRIEGGMDTMNLVNMFIAISKTISRVSEFGGGFGSDDFWIRAVARLLKNVINLLKLSKNDVSFDNINTLISELYILKASTQNPNVEDFQFLFDCKIRAKSINGLDGDKYLLLQTLHYIDKDFLNIPEKTSGNIQAMVMGLLDPFISGTLRDVMVGEVSDELNPEQVLKNGSMVLVNFPILSEYGVGAIIQSLYMRIMTQAIERRDLKKNDRPCCLFIDEAHYHIDDHLIRALSTGRSKKMIMVLATQSISGYFALIEGQRYKVKVDAFMANCVTKICCNANDYETLEYFVKTVGKGRIRTPEQDLKTNLSFDTKDKFYLEHNDFKSLSSGGAPNFLTEAIVVTSGMPKGKNYLKVVFDQTLIN